MTNIQAGTEVQYRLDGGEVIKGYVSAIDGAVVRLAFVGGGSLFTGTDDPALAIVPDPVLDSIVSLGELARFINTAHQAGKTVTVAGHTVHSIWSSQPARVWGTGSLSVDTKAKKGNGNNPVWFKAGAPLPKVVVFP